MTVTWLQGDDNVVLTRYRISFKGHNQSDISGTLWYVYHYDCWCFPDMTHIFTIVSVFL
jgi:hypothetical protein